MNEELVFFLKKLNIQNDNLIAEMIHTTHQEITIPAKMASSDAFKTHLLGQFDKALASYFQIDTPAYDKMTALRAQLLAQQQPSDFLFTAEKSPMNIDMSKSTTPEESRLNMSKNTLSFYLRPINHEKNQVDYDPNPL